MKIAFAPTSVPSVSLRFLSALTICILMTSTLLACNDGNERVLELEATVNSMDELGDALATENAELKDEIASLRQELEQANSKTESLLADKEQWSNGKDEKSPLPEDTALETTVGLVQDSGGEVHYVDHPGRQDRTVLLTPLEFADGATPLIVSLHGFGGNSTYQTMYVPLHERVNTDGFALLLPNGTFDAQGNRFWNPTDRCCDGGKSSEDDVAYLTEFVTEARSSRNSEWIAAVNSDADVFHEAILDTVAHESMVGFDRSAFGVSHRRPSC